MSIVAGEDIVNLRLKDRLKRIDAEIEEKKTVLEKKRETCPLKRLSDLEESLRHLEDRKEEVNRLVRKEVKSMSTRGPGRGDTCHLTDFSETWPD